MLEKNPACSRREMCDRLLYDYGENGEKPFFPTQVKREIAKLIKDKNYKVREKLVRFPDIIPFLFTFRLDCWSVDTIEDTMVKKVKAFKVMNNHSNRIVNFLVESF